MFKKPMARQYPPLVDNTPLFAQFNDCIILAYGPASPETAILHGLQPLYFPKKLASPDLTRTSWIPAVIPDKSSVKDIFRIWTSQKSASFLKLKIAFLRSPIGIPKPSARLFDHPPIPFLLNTQSKYSTCL